MYKAFQDLKVNDAVYEWNHGRDRYQHISHFKSEFLIYKWRVISVNKYSNTISVSFMCPFDDTHKTITVSKDDKDTSLSKAYFSDLDCLINELLKGLEEVKKYSINRFKGNGFYHHLLNKDGDDIREIMYIIHKLNYRMLNVKTKMDYLFQPYSNGKLKVNLMDLIQR